MSYKPFLSIFNMTDLASSTNPAFPNPVSMVDYASVAVFELRPNEAGSHNVRFGFKNGSSTETDVTYYPLFGSDNVDMDLNTFVHKIEVSLSHLFTLTTLIDLAFASIALHRCEQLSLVRFVRKQRISSRLFDLGSRSRLRKLS